jgi:hypothetical protein
VPHFSHREKWGSLPYLLLDLNSIFCYRSAPAPFFPYEKLGPPWTTDQKSAALAAFLLLAS